MKQPNRFQVGIAELVLFISVSATIIVIFGWFSGWWGGSFVDDSDFRIGDLASERAERICVERYAKETGGRAQHGAPMVSPYDTHRSEREVTIHGTIGSLNATAICKVGDGEITEFILLE